MGAGDSLAQSQPQACAALGPGPGLVYHVKRLRDPVQGLLGDAPAVVGDLEQVTLRGGTAQQLHGGPGLGGLAGIVQEVVQQGLQ